MSLSLVTPPAVEPITLDQAKLRLRISDNAQDSRLVHLIRVARQRVERETGQALLSQTWLERRDAWDGDGRMLAFSTQFRLLKPPLMALEALTVYDVDDTPTVIDPSGFFIDTLAEPGRIALKPDTAWPQPGRAVGGIEIRFRCGYGDSVDDVPAPLVEAVSKLVDAMWRDGAGIGLPMAVRSLMAPWRRLSL
jgi:uncharacterized phiE125 gp8 family phage protein